MLGRAVFLGLTICVCLAHPGLAAPRPQRAGTGLRDVVLIIDSGHGDRAVGDVPADPGAFSDSVHGRVWECVFTWDTSMRLKRSAESRGARVFLTLQDPDADETPHDWGPEKFPSPGSSFAFKTLLANPTPRSEDEALVARVQAANDIYRKYQGSADIYFISVHFDSTAPDLAGMSFYYPPENARPRFADMLEAQMRNAGRARSELRSGEAVGVSSAHAYTVLSASENPDAYLIELGNMQSRDAEGRNPDLWRMRNPATRQAYADLIADALERHVAGQAAAPRGKSRRSRFMAGAVLAIPGLLAAAWWLFAANVRRGRRSHHPAPAVTNRPFESCAAPASTQPPAAEA